MPAEPLPCPFCGNRHVVVDLDTESVICNECGATGPSMLSRRDLEDADATTMLEEAMVAWNKRA